MHACAVAEVGGGSKPAKVEGNRRMSVMPAAPTATQVAARSDQLSKLITTCLAEVPQPALISTVVEKTAKKISVVQPTSGSQGPGATGQPPRDWARPRRGPRMPRLQSHGDTLRQGRQDEEGALRSVVGMQMPRWAEGHQGDQRLHRVHRVHPVHPGHHERPPGNLGLRRVAALGGGGRH